MGPPDATRAMRAKRTRRMMRVMRSARMESAASRGRGMDTPGGALNGPLENANFNQQQWGFKGIYS